MAGHHATQRYGARIQCPALGGVEGLARAK